jgi:tellurite resistance protein
MSSASRIPVVPASAFGVVLGLAGLGGAWRAAHQVWAYPEAVGEALMLAAAVVWFVVLVLYGLKWMWIVHEARAEVLHPIQCCFVGLIGVSTMLVAGGALPYSRLAAEILFGVGAAWTILFAVWRIGGLWQGGRDVAATTPVLYLPTVAGSFVLATVGSALGLAVVAQIAFGAGLLGWLAIDSVLWHRFYVGPQMPPALRPTMGIQMAPPVVGLLAYLSVTTGIPDLWAHAFLGYAILMALVLLRLLPWVMQQPFSLSYWAFSFGVASLAGAPARMVARGDAGAVVEMAPYLFAAGNVVIAFLVLGTLRLAIKGQLLPKPLMAVQPGGAINDRPTWLSSHRARAAIGGSAMLGWTTGREF